MIGKQLNRDWPLRREVILRREFAGGLVKKFRRIRRDDVALFRVSLDQKRLMFQFAIVFHRVEQVERVLGPNVVRVTLKRLLDHRPPFSHLAQPQQGHPQIQVGRPQTR